LISSAGVVCCVFDPDLSETEEVRVMRVNEIRVDRVKNGTDIISADREVDRARI